MKVALRNTGYKMVNIPSEIWKEAGWSINDEVHIEVREMESSDGLIWKGVVIEREKDWTEE
jgi:bifunctional DNA-binding transcriptional regulator/antitoxin component of YhaV-PrlF toxin-antitoxin module